MSDRPTTNLELLRRTTFFATAGEAAMTRLLRPSFTQQLPRGTILFDQNEQADFLHLLLSGSVGLTARDETGAETTVEIFRAGEMFLAPAAILRLPYLASGAALTDVRVLMIPSETFREGLTQDPALSRAALELLARHWRLMVDQVVDIKLRPAERRVARFLANRVAAEAGSGAAEIPEPRSAIAARLGMSAETLSRTLNGLEARGAIRLSAKRVDILDRARLLNRGE